MSPPSVRFRRSGRARAHGDRELLGGMGSEPSRAIAGAPGKTEMRHRATPARPYPGGVFPRAIGAPARGRRVSDDYPGAAEHGCRGVLNRLPDSCRLLRLTYFELRKPPREGSANERASSPRTP